MSTLVKSALLSAALLAGLPMAGAMAHDGRDGNRYDRHDDWRRGEWERHRHRHWDNGWRGYDRPYYYVAPRYYRPPPVYYVRPVPRDYYYYEPYGAQFTLNFR